MLDLMCHDPEGTRSGPSGATQGSRHDACLECGKPVATVRQAEFCSPACRSAWNARRAQRGAELYDLAMGWRFPFGERPSV